MGRGANFFLFLLTSCFGARSAAVHHGKGERHSYWLVSGKKEE